MNQSSASVAVPLLPGPVSVVSLPPFAIASAVPAVFRLLLGGPADCAVTAGPIPDSAFPLTAFYFLLHLVTMKPVLR